MAYLDSLSVEQKSNAANIIKAAVDSGITNQYAIAAILAIISKESEFKPKSENLNYSVKRIKEVFPSLGSRANFLGNNPEALGNAIYGGRYGNGANEGYKYRGRGYNQLTFKGNYDKFAKIIKVDIVNSPNLVNDPVIAAKIAIAFFIDGIKELKRTGKLELYNASGINDFKNLTDSILAMYHINAGTGKKVSNIKNLQVNDIVGGFTKAKARIQNIYNDLKNIIEDTATNLTQTVKDTATELTEAAKKNNVIPILVIGLIVTYFILNKNQQ